MKNRMVLLALFGTLVLVISLPVFLNFHPTIKLSSGNFLVATSVGIVLAPAFAWLAQRAGGDRSRRTAFKKLLAALLLMPLFALGIMALSLPYLHTLIRGHNSILQGTVVEKSSGGFKRRSCDYYVYLDVVGVKSRDKHCISKEQWTRTDRGDRFRMEVTIGPYGYVRHSIWPAI